MYLQKMVLIPGNSLAAPRPKGHETVPGYDQTILRGLKDIRASRARLS